MIFFAIVLFFLIRRVTLGMWMYGRPYGGYYRMHPYHYGHHPHGFGPHHGHHHFGGPRRW